MVVIFQDPLESNYIMFGHFESKFDIVFIDVKFDFIVAMFPTVFPQSLVIITKLKTLQTRVDQTIDLPDRIIGVVVTIIVLGYFFFNHFDNFFLVVNFDFVFVYFACFSLIKTMK